MDDIGRFIDDVRRDVEFRDGVKSIPAYLADMMAGIPTHTLTLEEAVAAANRRQLDGIVGKAQEEAIRKHFGGPR
jgi:hypothetical protein